MRWGAVALLVFSYYPAAAWSQPVEPTYLGAPRPATVPKRVVSLAPNLTEILFALGVGDRVVGVTRYDDYPPEVKKLPRVGGFIDPSVEAILALKPDLVVCVPNMGGKNRLETLSKIGVPVLVLPAYAMEDIFKAFRVLGRVFEKTSESETLMKDMRSRIRRIEKLLKDRPRPRVLLIYGHRPIMAAGKGSFGDTLIHIAGGQNVLADSKLRYPTVPMEVVIRLKPEVIIDASASGTGAEMTPKEVQRVWNRWKILPAVRSHRVFRFDSALWFRLGPRIVDGLDKLVGLLHPEIGRSR
jgi:iron complex transport system substrate-binding protein